MSTKYYSVILSRIFKFKIKNKTTGEYKKWETKKKLLYYCVRY